MIEYRLNKLKHNKIKKKYNCEQIILKQLMDKKIAAIANNMKSKAKRK